MEGKNEIDYLLGCRIANLAELVFDANQKTDMKFSILVTPVGISVMCNGAYIGGVVSINDGSKESANMFLDAIKRKINELVDDRLSKW